MKTGHGAPPPLIEIVQTPVPVLPGGAATVPVPVLNQEALCHHAVQAAQSVVPDESLIWLLETAVAQLHQVVAELGRVGAGTRQVAERVHALQAIDWESPAGAAFAERSQRLRLRAEQLASTAEEQAVLGRAAIDDLHQRIGRLRAELAAARAVLTTAATLGVC
ncbi:MAG: hypothetical protein QJR09_05550 [Micrococcus sp.]|nr:hypothetical protein [Micrococcus sp.]